MSRKTKTTRKRTSRRKASKPSFMRRWWDSFSLDQKAGALKAVLRIAILCVVVIAAGWGMKKLESHVRSTTAPKQTAPVRLEVSESPEWMPAELAYQIAQSFDTEKKDVRYDDADLTDEIAARARANPWVKSVRSVRKARNAEGKPFVKVDCEFRKPAAMVYWRKNYYFVDEQGVRLRDSRKHPEVPRWTAIIPARPGRKVRQEDFIELDDMPADAERWLIHYIVVELDGEMDSAPPAPGKYWDSKALQAGLKLTALLKTRSYASQVSSVDARNHGGRRSRALPHLTFSAGNSDFQFGRFSRLDGDHNVSTRQKMRALDSYVARYRGKLAGTPGMNLQIENPYE